ncbi:MAG: hypothetical protein AB7P40_29195 [Chloroflexota bacterium]
MNSQKFWRHGALITIVLLVMLLLHPGYGFAAQDQPEAAPSPTPDRAPSYQRGEPAGALRLSGDPPAAGKVIVEDALASPGVIPGKVSCPSGKNIGEFVGEGYIVKISGRCVPEASAAAMTLPGFPDLEIPDGEIRVEAKVVSGHDRADIWISFREQRNPSQGYLLAAVPALGFAGLVKYDQNASAEVPLAMRDDLAGRYSRDDWNELAVRLAGPNIWVLLNGQPVLSASDSTRDRGGLSFGVKRLGGADDNAESAVVFRNLRVSQLAP